MNKNISSTRDGTTAFTNSFERYLQDKGKGRGGDGGNYRRNATRELERFHEWARGERGNDKWDGVVSDDPDREPTFDDLDERVFREYARHLAGDRGLKQNSVKTYYAYISAWCGWCVDEGYLEAHYAQRASAMAPLPEDDGRKPGDQQAWTPEQRHALTRHVDETAREAIEQFTALPEDTDPLDRQRARYTALRAARDRALVGWTPPGRGPKTDEIHFRLAGQFQSVVVGDSVANRRGQSIALVD